MCAAEREYRVKLADGSVREMTATQIVDETKLPRKLIVKRLNQYGIRELARLSATPEAGIKMARRAFKLGMRGELASNAHEKRQKIEHEKRVLLGNPEVE